MQDRTAHDIITQAYETQPHIRLAVSKSGDTIGSWSEEKNRFVVVAGRYITGEWVSLPYELLVNGKPLVTEWAEVPRA